MLCNTAAFHQNLFRFLKAQSCKYDRAITTSAASVGQNTLLFLKNNYVSQPKYLSYKSDKAIWTSAG